jgi:hypothetical protein
MKHKYLVWPIGKFCKYASCLCECLVHVPHPRGWRRIPGDGTAGVEIPSPYMNSHKYHKRLHHQSLLTKIIHSTPSLSLLFALSNSALYIICRKIHSKMDRATSDEHCDLQHDQEQSEATTSSVSLSPVRLTPIDSSIGHADPFLSMAEQYTDIWLP